MKNGFVAAAAFAALMAAPLAQAQADTQAEPAPQSRQAKRVATEQAKLAKMLEGREAGEPERCITMRPTDQMQVIEGTALVFRSGSTMWVNTTADPESIDKWDTYVFRRYGSQLCSMDIVTTLDRGSGMYNGNVSLVEFVPWRKPKD